MLPPRDVYSLKIHNHADEEVTLVVVYTLPCDKGSKTLKITLKPKHEGAAPQELVTEGSCTFTGAITLVEVEGHAAKLTAPFPGVDSPVKDYVVTIKGTHKDLVLEGRLPSA